MHKIFLTAGYEHRTESGQEMMSQVNRTCLAMETHKNNTFVYLCDMSAVTHDCGSFLRLTGAVVGPQRSLSRFPSYLAPIPSYSPLRVPFRIASNSWLAGLVSTSLMRSTAASAYREMLSAMVVWCEMERVLLFAA